MANLTSKGNSTLTPYSDNRIKRPLAAAAATYYIGGMIALDGSGNAVKCDDTAGIKFDGIAVGFSSQAGRVTVPSGGSAGDYQVEVARPFRFTMPIVSASAGDEGTRVYALYDGTVTKTGVSNSILVGKIDRVISSTEVEIVPIYAATLSVATFDGATLTFTGSTGGNTIVMPDNLADALSVVEGANAYVTFVTTNSGESINIKKTVLFPGTTGTNLIKMTDNLADALSIQEGSNKYVTFVTTDSGETITLGKSVTLPGTTGVGKLILTDNLASALDITEASNSYLKFTTTNSAETVTVGVNLTFADAKNVVVNATTGTKIGTATTQKLGFFNATPVTQPAANADATTGAAGGTNTVYLNTTWTGSGGTAAFTIGGVVTALKALGLLAA